MPNLGCFRESHNLDKIENLVKSFYGMIDHPLGHLSSKYYIQKSIQRGVIIFQVRPFFALLLNLEHFGNFYQLLHILYSIS